MRPSVLLLLLAACAEGPEDQGCPYGLDMDQDGVCDSESVDWSVDASIEAGTNRGNVYGLAEDDLQEVRARGLEHAMVWPVDVTGILIPIRPFDEYISTNPTAAAVARQTLGFGSFPEFYEWLGLPHYPEASEEGRYMLPVPDGFSAGDPIGLSFMDTPRGEGVTFACTTCHAGELFGRPVIGLTNRRARANAVFLLASEFVHTMDAETFQGLTGATDGEREMYQQIIDRIPSIGAKKPEVLGLDTAVAQIGLSLGRRGEDPFAEYSVEKQNDPDFAYLETYVADSKPAVWWNLRYKTRWLSDGSLTSGNPLYYNYLANELGRGTDLHELDDWLRERQEVVDELTVAVFATEAPRWTDFLGLDGLDEVAAREGQAIFAERCASCHGTYEKGWDAPDAGSLSAEERFATTRVTYHEQTPVMDVGTDLQRAVGGQDYVDRLNGLAIVSGAGSVFTQEGGYVPPPLDGIWTRYPYLHNNSVPTLCALLSPPEERPVEFWQGPADDPETDFDADCVGYPVGEAVPEGWREDEARFDATVLGLGNGGHDQMLRDGDGTWNLDEADRSALIAFLKTL